MHLALPLSALGVGGSLVAAGFLRVDCFAGDDRLATSLAAFVPPAAVGLGLFFAPRIVSGRRVPTLADVGGCALAMD
jgi:hypothetical protein